MSFFVAALWSILAVFGLEFLLGLLPSVRANGHPDLVSGVLCQAAAFLGTLLFFTQVHEKDRPLSEVLGLRRTSTTLCLVATALGLAMQGPLTLIQDAIERRYPLPEKEAQDFAELFHAPFLHQKIAILLAAGFLGPIVEEMFFRGALLRAIRRRHPPGLTVVGVSLLFAAAHGEARQFFPILLGGLAMGYVRIMAGSLWPSVLVHSAFNTVGVGYAVFINPEGNLVSRPQSMVATVACVALIAIYRALAMRSEACAQARAADTV